MSGSDFQVTGSLPRWNIRLTGGVALTVVQAVGRAFPAAHSQGAPQRQPAVARWYQVVAAYEPVEASDTARMRALVFTLGQLAEYWSGRLSASATVIAKQSGMGRNTVTRLMSELDRAGLLRTDKRHGNGKPPQRSLTIDNRSAPVQSRPIYGGGDCTSAEQSKKARDSSSEYNSHHAQPVRARTRGDVDPLRGELGSLLAETRGVLRTARERGPKVGGNS